jgi:hypothetical protein
MGIRACQLKWRLLIKQSNMGDFGGNRHWSRLGAVAIAEMATNRPSIHRSGKRGSVVVALAVLWRQWGKGWRAGWRERHPLPAAEGSGGAGREPEIVVVGNGGGLGSLGMNPEGPAATVPGSRRFIAIRCSITGAALPGLLVPAWLPSDLIDAIAGQRYRRSIISGPARSAAAGPFAPGVGPGGRRLGIGPLGSEIGQLARFRHWPCLGIPRV